MIDVNFLRENPEKVKNSIASKNINPAIVDEFLVLDKQWRELVGKTDELRAQQKKMGAEKNIEGAKKLKEEIKEAEALLPEIEEKRRSLLYQIPNSPLPEVIVGKSEEENTVAEEAGQKPNFGFAPKDYLTIAENLGIIDTKRAAKVAGSRMAYILGDAALLEFALVQLVFNTVTNQETIREIIKKNNLNISDKPFVPVVTPVMIRKEAMQSMGYLERGGDEIYHFPKDDLFLVGTSEQAIGPMHQGEVIPKEELPLRYLGFSTCFRREAGSYGKDTKGILRVHQFDKLEMFSFVLPETSKEEHRLLLGIEKHLMDQLGLPYRVLNICSGDLGDSAAAKFDVEVWLPGQKEGAGEYRETHSTSNTTDFQARRLDIKYGPEKEYLHMLNGTAFAIGRIIAAIIENYQTENGGIAVPEVLQKYLGKKEIKRPE